MKSEKERQTYQMNREERLLKKRVKQLNKFGITETGKEVCLICGGVNKNGERLHLDHSHKTGKFRGHLCSNCNTALGLLNVDDKGIELLLGAISYIKQSGTI